MCPLESSLDEVVPTDDGLHPTDRLMRALGEIPFDPTEGEIIFVSYADGPVGSIDLVLDSDRMQRRIGFLLAISLMEPHVEEELLDDRCLVLAYDDLRRDHPPVLYFDRRPQVRHGAPPRCLGPTRSQVSGRTPVRRTIFP